MGLSELPRGSTMPFIIAVDFGDALNGGLEVGEQKQAFADSIPITKTGILRQHRPAAGEIARAAVAKPASPQVSKNGFWTTEFGPGTLNIICVYSSCARDLVRQCQLPAMLLKEIAIGCRIVGIDVCGKLERPACSPRQFDEAQVGVALGDAKRPFAPPYFSPIPLGDRSEWRIRTGIGRSNP